MKGKKQINHKDGNGLNNNVENLEWATPSENGLHSYRILGNKSWTVGKNGKEHPKSKKVIQRTIEGRIVKIWDCASDAVRLGGFESGQISRCCNKINKTHKGYVWEFGI